MNQTVLIADGDAEWCDLLRRFLSDRGYDVKTSLDGLDCLEKLRRFEPAVLVLDEELRWGGGDGVLAWLYEESPEIPVILTGTASYRQHFAAHAEPSVMDYLRKPFGMATLLESVRSAATKMCRGEPANLKRAFAAQ